MPMVVMPEPGSLKLKRILVIKPSEFRVKAWPMVEGEPLPQVLSQVVWETTAVGVAGTLLTRCSGWAGEATPRPTVSASPLGLEIILWLEALQKS